MFWHTEAFCAIPGLALLEPLQAFSSTRHFHQTCCNPGKAILPIWMGQVLVPRIRDEIVICRPSNGISRLFLYKDGTIPSYSRETGPAAGEPGMSLSAGTGGASTGGREILKLSKTLRVGLI